MTKANNNPSLHRRIRHTKPIQSISPHPIPVPTHLPCAPLRGAAADAPSRGRWARSRRKSCGPGTRRCPAPWRPIDFGLDGSVGWLVGWLVVIHGVVKPSTPPLARPPMLPDPTPHKPQPPTPLFTCNASSPKKRSRYPHSTIRRASGRDFLSASTCCSRGVYLTCWAAALCLFDVCMKPDRSEGLAGPPAYAYMYKNLVPVEPRPESLHPHPNHHHHIDSPCCPLLSPFGPLPSTTTASRVEVQLEPAARRVVLAAVVVAGRLAPLLHAAVGAGLGELFVACGSVVVIRGRIDIIVLCGSQTDEQLNNIEGLKNLPS